MIANSETKAEHLSKACRLSEQHRDEKCNYIKMECKVNGLMYCNAI